MADGFKQVTGPAGNTYYGTDANADYWLGTQNAAQAQQKNFTSAADQARQNFFQLASNEPPPGSPGYADWKAKRDAAEAEYNKAAADARGTNPDGSPKRPDFQSISNPDGTLQKAYQLGDWKNVNADTSALNQYKQDALRSAGQPSAWANLALQKQGLEESNAVDQANQGGQNAGLMAQMQLARSGGLSGAARERAAGVGAFQAMQAAQQARNQGAQARAGIGLTDEQNRMQGLQNLQGMQNTQAQAQYKNQLEQQGVQKANIGNMLNEVGSKRAYDAGAYSDLMKSWAAGRTADAQTAAANSGGGKK